MNEKINEIVEHTSRIDGLLKSEISSSGRFITVAPTRGEYWESALAVWAIKRGIYDLTECSFSLFDDMEKFYKRVKRSEFPGDFDECVRSI
jgi:hypothetical protein